MIFTLLEVERQKELFVTKDGRKNSTSIRLFELNGKALLFVQFMGFKIVELELLYKFNKRY